MREIAAPAVRVCTHGHCRGSRQLKRPEDADGGVLANAPAAVHLDVTQRLRPLLLLTLTSKVQFVGCRCCDLLMSATQGSSSS